MKRVIEDVRGTERPTVPTGSSEPASGASGGRRAVGRVMVGAIAVAVIAGMVLLAGCTEQDEETTTTANQSGADTTQATESAEAGMVRSPAVDVAQQVGPSVVNVAVAGVVQSFSGGQEFSGAGSGVIFTSEGMIVTNNHVVAPDGRPAEDITVALATGEELQARVVGRDPVTDLAVLEVDAEDDLPVAEFIEDFGEVQVGQYAIAIGNPLSYANSVTMGIVSGLHREIPAPPAGAQAQALVDLVQTDAAISPGNSGGALVDAQGRVIGINVAYLPPGQTGAQDLGFAIPSDVVVDVATQLIETGRVSHPFMGIQPISVTEGLQQRFELSRSSGVLIAQVEPGTPAADAGLQQGDIVIAIDDEETEEVTDLFSILRQMDVGETISVDFVRGEEERTVDLTLTERPQQ